VILIELRAESKRLNEIIQTLERLTAEENLAGSPKAIGPQIDGHEVAAGGFRADEAVLEAAPEGCAAEDPSVAHRQDEFRLRPRYGELHASSSCYGKTISQESTPPRERS
jgi:hypothetical protein